MKNRFIPFISMLLCLCLLFSGLFGYAVATETGTDTNTGTDTSVTPDTGTDSGTDTPPGTGTDTGTDTPPGSGTDTGTDTPPGSGTDSGTGTDTGTETEPGTETDPTTETEPPTIYFFRDPNPAEENDPDDPDAAQNISGKELIAEITGYTQHTFLFNKRTATAGISGDTASITLEYPDGMGWLYFIFDQEYGTYTVINNDTGEKAVCGENRFLHETIDLVSLFGAPVKSLTVSFTNGPVSICELYVYTPGYLPSYVQTWEVPKEGQTDLILFSTHGDDDQLFFAGVLPYYCALDYEVMVVYMTDHRDHHTVRVHEMLNGLWEVGVRSYPVFGDFADFFADNLTEAYTYFLGYGTTRDDLIEFILEQLRRYKPMVVVGHDFNGEYRHGQHMAYADCLAAALEISNDPSAYPALAETYGLWEVPKAYFHLYEGNPIVMDWDTPMDELDGLTPFQVTQLYGYTQHVSQRESWVSNWINGYSFNITRADQITEYSPCNYGLYHTTVGEDVQKNDFFENVLSHAQQAQKDEEERLAAEEESQRQEEERLAAEEEARRQEEERLAAEAEAERQEALHNQEEPASSENSANLRLYLAIGCAVIAIVGGVILVIALRSRKRGRYE